LANQSYPLDLTLPPKMIKALEDYPCKAKRRGQVSAGRAFQA